MITGIKPTGRPHLGNYLGTIQPALALAQQHKAYFFIADYHALTTMRNPLQLEATIHEVAATWLALGLDPGQAIFYRQSAIPEIFELMWMLTCFATKSLLNRAHAYKAAVALNRAGDRERDRNISVGLYSYPLLMAADILAVDAQWVAVGPDQRQHVEIARDLVRTFNRTYGPLLRMPQALISESVGTIAGLDGRKMSKSYDNVIPVMSAPDLMRKLIRRIVTDSRPIGEPKDPDRCHVFNIYRHFAPKADVARVREQYLNGGLSYRRLKQTLGSLLARRFAPARERYAELMADKVRLSSVLAAGALNARSGTGKTLARLRQAIGIGAIGPSTRLTGGTVD